MGLKLKASKCKSLSIVSGKPQVIDFSLGDDILETLDKENHKFLGSTITFSNKQSDIYEVVLDFFQTRLERIDNLLIRDEYKVKLYDKYLLPASKFILTVHNLSATNLDRIDAVTTRFLKKWLHLPSSATPAVIHTSQVLSIKSIKHLYHECQTNAHISSRMKADAKVTNVLDSRLSREEEWSRKKSTIVACENNFQLAVESKNVAEINILKKEAKKNINQEMQDHWFNHLKGLVVQGSFLTSEECSKDINYRSIIYDLPRNLLKFLTNASIDTLPTNVNLKRWNKRNSPACGLCGNKETLLHVLNSCKVMLDQGRYTWRHNSILHSILTTLKNNNPHSLEIFCDLPGRMEGISTVPTDRVVTNQKPDIVIVDRENKKVTFFELTVPFDTNIRSAHERKLDRYSNLVSDINQTDFDAHHYAVEIGSRGTITKDNQQRLNELFKTCEISKKDINSLITKISKIAIVSSYCIFYSKFESMWIDPNYVTV